MLLLRGGYVKKPFSDCYRGLASPNISPYPHRMVGFIPHRMPQVQLLWGCQLPCISTIGVRLHTYLPFQLWLPPGMWGSMGIWGSGETWDPLSCEDNRHLCVWKFHWYWSISLLGTCFWQNRSAPWCAFSGGIWWDSLKILLSFRVCLHQCPSS